MILFPIEGLKGDMDHPQVVCSCHQDVGFDLPMTEGDCFSFFFVPGDIFRSGLAAGSA